MFKSSKSLFIFLGIAIVLSFTIGYSIPKNHISSPKGIPSEPVSTNTTTPEKNIHYAYLNDRDYFEEAFQNLPQPKSSKDDDIKGFIIPHHLVAKKLIANTFNQVSSDKPLTVFLISPNHFNNGRGQIITSKYNWSTPYGNIEPDTQTIDKLSQIDNTIKVDESPFGTEHGISNEVSFIKKTLPQAKIVPLIIKNTISQNQINTFTDNITQNLPENYLFVASLDFCHNKGVTICNQNDKKSLSILSKFDYKDTKNVDVDSQAGLQILLQSLNKLGYSQFNLLENTNSVNIIGEAPNGEMVSYITGYITKKSNSKKVDILSFGDMMLDRYIRNAINTRGFDAIFENMKSIIKDKNIVLANLEGSFTSFTPKALTPNNLQFTFDPNIVPKLKDLGFTHFGLANNHSLNFGFAGLNQTKDFLKKSDINYFGDPNNKDSISFIQAVNGLNIGLIGYHEFNSPDTASVTKEIKALKDKTDFIIVYPHWGIEYQTQFSKAQQDKAHQFIDAGADTVIGAHPHVIQPVEIYQNKAIFYSLGNFIFDQTFSQNTQQGLAVNITLQDNSATYTLIPLESRNLTPFIAGDNSRKTILSKLAENSSVSEDIKSQLELGIINLTP